MHCYPIDTEYVFQIAASFFAAPGMHNRTIDVAMRSFPVLELVRIMKLISCRKANCLLTGKGTHYDVDREEIKGLSAILHLDWSTDYLGKVLRMYFDRW